MSSFVLDRRLVSDSVLLGDMELSRVLLMNDSRFPWLVLVPRKPECVEVFDLSPSEQNLLIAEITRASRILRSVASAEKINIGAPGNIVSQLHVHIVARSRADPAWPGPCWGFEKPVPYAARARTDWTTRLSTALELRSQPN